MAKADIGCCRKRLQVMLVAQEAARQIVAAAATCRRAGAAVILRGGMVQARAANHPAVVIQIAGQLAEQAVVVEISVLVPGEAIMLGECAGHHVVAGVALAVLIGLSIHTCHQLVITPLPGCRQTSAQGATVDVAGHRIGHHAHAGWRAQAVVVHHVIGIVVVDPRLDLLQHLADIVPLEPQGDAFTLELAAVHAAPGVAGFAVTTADRQLQQRVFVRRPAEHQVGAPLVPARMHVVAVTVLVVIGVGAVGQQADVTLLATGGGIDIAVEATIGADQEAGVDPPAQLAEILRITLEEDGRRRVARPPEHGLRPLDHRQRIVVLRCDVGAGRVHAARAGAEHLGTVGQQLQARTEHAAEYRVAVGAAATHGGETGNGLQVVTRVAGRHRLTRNLRIGRHRQRRLLGDAGDDHGRQFGGTGMVRLFTVIDRLGGQRTAGEQAQQGRMGDLPAQTGRLNRKTLGQARTRPTATSNAGHRNFHFCI